MSLTKYYNSSTNSYQNTPVITPSSNTNTSIVDTGRSLGTAPNAAQNQMGAEAVGGVAQVGSSIIGGIASYNQNKISSAQDEKLANINRSDVLKQNKVNYGIKQQQLEQEKKKFALEKVEANETLRHDSWLAEFQKAMDQQKRLQGIVDNMNTRLSNTEDIKNITVNNFKRNK